MDIITEQEAEIKAVDSVEIEEEGPIDHIGIYVVAEGEDAEPLEEIPAESGRYRLVHYDYRGQQEQGIEPLLDDVTLDRDFIVRAVLLLVIVVVMLLVL